MMPMFRTADPIEYELLKANARRMRNNPTPAEQALWQMIKREQLGCSFRRQFIIGIYIVDLVCLSRKLIIEIDGKYHLNAEQQKEDAIRTANLESRGYRILRFTNEQVLCEPDNTINTIIHYL